MPKSGKKNRFGHRIGQDSSPNQDKLSNPLKKSRTEKDSTLTTTGNGESFGASDGNSPHSVQNLVTIDVDGSHAGTNQYSRLAFINNQTNNRYAPSNLPPYIVHTESKESMGNIGNLHPMKLDKLFANSSFITDIRRIGRNIISVNFKYKHEANSFVENENSLPDNLISYILCRDVFKTSVTWDSRHDNEALRILHSPEPERTSILRALPFIMLPFS